MKYIIFLLIMLTKPSYAQQILGSVNIEAPNLLTDSICAPIFSGGDTALFEIIFSKLDFIKQDTKLINGSSKFINFFIEIDSFGYIIRSKQTNVSKSYDTDFNKIFSKLITNLNMWIPAFKKNDKKNISYILFFKISVTKKVIELNIDNIDSQTLITTSRRIKK